MSDLGGSPTSAADHSSIVICLLWISRGLCVEQEPECTRRSLLHWCRTWPSLVLQPTEGNRMMPLANMHNRKMGLLYAACEYSEAYCFTRKSRTIPEPHLGTKAPHLWSSGLIRATVVCLRSTSYVDLLEHYPAIIALRTP